MKLDELEWRKDDFLICHTDKRHLHCCYCALIFLSSFAMTWTQSPASWLQWMKQILRNNSTVWPSAKGRYEKTWHPHFWEDIYSTVPFIFWIQWMKQISRNNSAEWSSAKGRYEKKGDHIFERTFIQQCSSFFGYNEQIDQKGFALGLT